MGGCGYVRRLCVSFKVIVNGGGCMWVIHMCICMYHVDLHPTRYRFPSGMTEWWIQEYEMIEWSIEGIWDEWVRYWGMWQVGRLLVCYRWAVNVVKPICWIMNWLYSYRLSRVRSFVIRMMHDYIYMYYLPHVTMWKNFNQKSFLGNVSFTPSQALTYVYFLLW